MSSSRGAVRGFLDRIRTIVPAGGGPRRPQAAPPFKRKPLFESLEQRLLLSADISPTAGSQLLDGLQELKGWAAELQQYGALSQSLPVAAPDGIGPVSIGTALDIASVFEQKLFNPVQAYLSGGGTKTTDGLVAALGGVAGITAVSGDQFGDTLRFDVVLDLNKAVNGLRIAIGATQDGTQVTADANGKVDASAQLLLDFSFGLDLDSQLAPQEAFFIQLDAFNAKLAASATGLNFGANIGFLGANVANGSFNLNAGLAVGLNNPDSDAEGRITLAELLGTTLEGLVGFTPSGSFNANFPISVSMGNFAPANTALTIAGNPLDPASIVVNVAGPSREDILNFGRANKFIVAEALQQIGGWLDSLTTSAAFNQALPFAQGKSFSDVLDFGQAFTEGFLSQLESAPGVPAFDNAQQFAQKIADLLFGGDLGSVALNYNAATNQLTFHLRLDRTFANVEAPVGFSVNLSPLGGLTSSSTLNVDANGRIQFTIGFDLSPFVAVWDSAVDLPLNGQLSGDASFTVRVNDATQNTLVTVARDTTNTTRAHLIADINAAIQAAGITGLTASLQGTRLRFTVAGNALGANLQFGVPNDATNPAKSQLGLPVVGFVSDGLTSKTFLRDIRVTGRAQLSAADVDALASFGIFQVGIANGSINGEATLDVQVRKNNNAANPIYMGELYQVFGNIPAYTAITRSGNVSGTLPIALQGGSVIALPGNPRMQFSMSNVFQPNTLTINLLDLAPLQAYQNFSIQTVINGLTSLANFFNSVEGFSFLDRKLPLLNRSVTDLVSFVNNFQAAVTSLQNAGNITLQQLEQRLEHAFGLDDTPSALSLVLTANDLQINLHLTEQIPASLRQIAMDLDFASLPGGNSGNLAGVGHLIDVSGSAKLNVSASADLNLHFGFDLTNPATPRPYIRDDSTFSLTALVSGSDLDFDAAIGPLGIFIRNGTARLDNGVGIPALFTLGFNQTAGDKWYSNSWNTGIVTASLVGQAQATLPVYFPLATTALGTIQLAVGNLANIPGTTTLTAPNLAAEIQAINLFDDMDALLQGIDLILAAIQDAMDGKFLGVKLPLIGDALKDQAKFVEILRQTLKTDLQAAFANGQSSVTAVQNALFKALGPTGLKVLPSAIVSASQIAFQRINDASGKAERIEFDLTLTQSQGIAVPIGFDIGLPGLGLAAADSASVLLVLDYAMKLGFGVSRSQGVYLKTYNDQDELRVGVSATLKDAAFGGTLGFLRVRIDDDAANPTGLFGGVTINLTDPDNRLTFSEIANGVDLASRINVGFSLTADVNLHLEAGAPNFEVSNPASADFFMKEFPRIESELNLRWVFAPGGSATGTLERAELNGVRLNLGTFFSGFLGPIFEVLDPILAAAGPLIDVLTEPLPVFSDIAGRNYTLIDLAQDLNGSGNFISAEALDFIEATVVLLDLIKNVKNFGGDGVYIEFGGVDLKSFDLKNSNFSFGGFGANQNPFAGKQINAPGQSLQAQLESKAPAFAQSKNSIKGTAGSGFSIPLIDNPLRVFDLLLGRDVDLFRYDMPEFAFSFSHRWKFGPVYAPPPVFVTLSGGVKAGFNFGFGYDTSGLRRMAEQAKGGGEVNPLLIFDGFFVADWDRNGNERPEAYIEGKIGAGAEVSAIIVSAGVEGGIFARVGLDLDDPNDDGRMHGYEILSGLAGGGGPICLFDFFGEIGAFLSVYVEVGIWPFSFTFDMEIARVTLIDWTIDICHEPEPILATQEGETLYLNMGSRAAFRMHGDTVDGEEAFVVKHLVDGTVMVEAFGVSQVYGKYKLEDNGDLTDRGTPITLIIADGGAMNDSIEIKANVPIRAELKGGAGDDVLIAGGGRAVIQGGAGKDTIYGSELDDELYGDSADGSGAQGDDIIYGRGGNDRIYGGGGDDVLYGEAGDDEIHGGAGRDILFGQAGRDHLFGDAGDDALFGGLGADQLEGGAGSDYLIGGDAEAGLPDVLYGHSASGSGDDNARDYLFGDNAAGLLPAFLADFAAPGAIVHGEDRLYGQGGSDYIYGEAGIDEIYGGAGNDFIFGGDGADIIRGEAGNDDIRGEAGDDLIYGGTGDDLIRGDQGNDLVYGDAGRDTIYGGSGEDTLFGGDDDDFIRGQEGDDQVYGDAGNDDLYGDAGRDILVGGLGNDRLTGGAGDDVLRGSDGDDTLYGSAGNDFIYGEAGIDVLYGNDGDDYLDGGSGADSLYGGAGDDTLMAGTGLGKQLYGDAGDDLIIGSAEGRDDDDLLDAVYFGDVIHGGAGDDRLYGLGGADIIYGGDGDDEIWGGAHGDYLLGGAGFDRIYGGMGADRIEGGADGDYIDGGYGVDMLFGDAGDDEILGGGGADQIFGGAGDDILRGSDDAPDTIRGGSGMDRIFGNGGNDLLYGDAGDDVIEGGAGDDIIEGGAGEDVLIGGAQHDTLYGHSASGSGDDDAVDYLYGDFGTNLNAAGAGNDRLFGQGGNDLLFGEGGDDQITAGGGTSNMVDFGTGEGADPTGYVVPAATPNPALTITPDEPYALVQLPSGLTPGGRWTEFLGSASGGGVSNSQAAALEPAIAIDAAGNRYVAWADARNGNYEIYVLRLTPAGAWEMLAGSAEGGGISASLSDSRRPSIALGADGNPIVAWTERTSTPAGIVTDIKVARYDAVNGAWVALGESLDGNGISNSGAADHATILITSGGPVVTWLDNSSGTRQVYAKRFAAEAWSAFGTNGASGGGASNAPAGAGVAEYSAATNGSEVAIAFSRVAGSDYEVYLTRSSGSAWGDAAGAASGNGLSNNVGDSRNPTVAYHAGSIFIAWQDQGERRQEIFVRRLDGGAWVAAGTGAAGGQGVSATTGYAEAPKLASNGGELYLMWADNSVVDRPGNAVSLHVKRWTGTGFAEPRPDDAANRGISASARQVQSFALAVDANGRPFAAWSAVDSGAPQVYLRGDTTAKANVHQVASSGALQALLDGGTLGANDIVVLASGNYDGTITIDADDSGVIIIGDGSQDSVFSGTLNITGATNVTLQRIRFTGEVNATNTTGLTLVDNDFAGTGTGLTINGGTDLKITHNRFSGAGGITVAAAAAGRIAYNDIAATGTGLTINAAFTGLIDHNAIHGAVTGVAYNAAAALAANRIYGNSVGVRSTVAGAGALGFVAGSAPNDVYANGAVGIELVNASVQGQHVYGHAVGVRGSGTIGGDTLDQANLIEKNTTGVAGFNGTVQFSRIARNDIGIAASNGLRILHNLIYRNAERGVNIAGVSDVRIYQNTFYAPTGDNIRLSGGASNVEIRGNILWAESGYDIYVANDSQTGFFSDYNDLYVSGSGRIGYWTKDFVDVLDWQADIAKFDLHSIGHTVIDPEWARPRFMGIGQDDYRLFQPVAALRFTSPTVDAGDARMDWPRPATEVNLLANPGFETGVSGWTTNVGASARSANPAAFEGGAYFYAGSIEEGFAQQVINLLDRGYSAAQLDASDLEVVFSGRLRSTAEAAIDRGKIVVTFLRENGEVLGTVEAAALNESTRWELVGGRADIPVGTRTIAFRFIADRDTGTTNDAFFDHAFLGIVSENVAPDLGAYGHAPTDVGLAATPRINIRFPDLYTDWEKDKPLTIRWETFGNTSDSPVRIDLYQDGPAGPALRATIAAATPDDGEYIWIPSTNGVDFGTYGLRIQISLNSNPLVLERSTETFTVPESGQNYWVDDYDNTGDQYTPGAIGDNRNTGKLATAPKPNPANLFRTYALNAGATLYVDTGVYPMIHALTLSGSFDLGFGLDEGFRMTGPSDAAAIALLLPAIPGDRSRPLITLNDADFVTIERLSLANALRGLDVANGSDSFTASWITAYGHAADGIRIVTNAPFSAYDRLTAYNNTGRGISITGPIASFTNGLAHHNSTDGIYLNGGVGLVSNSLAYDNGQAGIDVQSPGAGARIEANVAYGNNVGLRVYNSASGAAAIVGTTDLAANDSENPRGNLIYNNRQTGIAAAYNTRVSGNTVRDQTNTSSSGIDTFSGASISDNVVSGNYYGINVSSGGDVSNNRVYANRGYGIYGNASVGFIGNVVYSNPTNLYVGGNTLVRNNVIYDSDNYGVYLPGSSGTRLINNTIVALQGDAIRIQQNASNVTLRNNIIVAGAGYGVSVAADSQSGFVSDYNLFHTTGTGKVGLWQGVDRTGLIAWRNATFGDKNSIFGDPLFVDADGADGVLGYVSPANDGRDDDFHIRSQFGSFKGAALAPVAGGAGTGLPVFLPLPAATLDAQTSPALDRGAPGDDYANEPANNGGYINIGAYGNTAQASKSPAQFMLLTSPNGGEAIPQETSFEIRWRSTGFGGNVAIDISTGGGGAPVWAVLTANEANDGSYLWSVDPALYAIGERYLVRVRSLEVGAIQDQSDAFFSITEPISIFYVNDGSLIGDQYTTAIGDDANDGLSPSTPKATIRSVLETYDLDPGDVIRVDTGNYLLTVNIVLEAQDSGVVIEGPTLPGARAVLNRSNISSTSYVFQMAGADDVTLRNLAITGAYYGIYAANNAGSERLTVERSELYSNNQMGAYIVAGNNGATFNDNEIYFNGSWGLQLNAAGGRAIGNHVWGNGFGITASNSGGVARVDILDNRVHDNNSTGIDGAYWVLVAGNTVYGNGGSYGITMYDSRSLALGNEIFYSPNGLNLSVGAVGRENRVYANTGIGIHLTGGGGAVAEGNIVYGNNVGIQESSSRVAYNLVYDNTSAGIVTSGYRDTDDGIINNTVVQPAGDAIRVAANAQNVLLRNNVLEVGGGYAIYVPSNSQSGFASDYNLFRLTGSGKLGFWEDRDFLTLTDWYYEIGRDAESLTADPQLIDPAGADGVRGYSSAAVGSARIIDDGGPGFSVIGAWTPILGALEGPANSLARTVFSTAFDADIHQISGGGDGSNVARWAFDDLEDGTYQIAVRWPLGGGLAYQNGQYRAYDGEVSLDKLVAYTSMSQSNALNDFEVDGIWWERLDTVIVRNGRLIVELSDRGGATTSRLTADAVRVQRIVGDRGADDDFRLAVGSPGVDRGDPASRYELEPVNNGGRVDLGAYGNTALATQSPAQLVQVLNPNGLEKYEVGQEVRIDFRSAGLTQYDPVLLMNLGGGVLSGPGYWASGATPVVSGSSSNGTIAAGQVLDLSAANAGPDALYRSYRLTSSGIGATMGWSFEVPDGDYTLRLHFIEPSATAAGQRRFAVELQGAVAEADFDIYALANAATPLIANDGRYQALVREYTVSAADGEGIALLLRNLTSNGAVISGIEILRENAGGVANPTVDLEVWAGASWIPVAGGVALDRYGNGSFVWNAGPQANAALIRATAHAGTATVTDVSDVAFQIANAGTAYYVNDGSTAGDEYATAVGNNANDGKTAATPMASLAALLRAYDLDPGDVIYVDTGVYSLTTNIVLTAQDSGVTIRGPVLPTHTAVLDRGNTVSGAYVFELAGADDVIIEHVAITGGQYGLQSGNSVDSDRITLDSVTVYGNASGGVQMTDQTNDAFIVRNSEIYSNGTGVGINVSSRGGRIENNLVRNSAGGISVSASGSAAAERIVVSGNTVRNNTSYGINSSSQATVEHNTVYNNSGYGITSVNSSLLRQNVVYANTNGIAVGNGAVAEDNRVFNHAGNGSSSGIGIFTRDGSAVIGNRVYGNVTGVWNDDYSTVRGNLIYSNSLRGIRMSGFQNAGNGIFGNTIYQPVGDAIVVEGTGNYTVIRENILVVGTGYALYVAPTSQGGFDSDYNLFWLTGTGKLAFWEDRAFTSLNDWSLEVGFDFESLVANPLFVDVNGADGVLGYAGGVDGGLDDDFRLQVGSPGVDRGDPASRYERELANNGGRIDLGAYGNTPLATQSPAQLVQVLNPNGLEKYEVGQEVRIDFRSAGLTQYDPVLLMNLGGGVLSGLGYWAAGATPTGSGSSSNGTIAANQVLDLSAANAGPEALYRSYRIASSGVGATMGWSFDVPDGVYTLRLHFIEPSAAAAGQRRFAVELQGAVAEADFDIYALANAATPSIANDGRYQALVREYAVTAADGEGIALLLRNLTANGAVISGIEILRENAGGVANPTVDLEVSTNGGTSWIPVAGGVALDRYGNGSFVWNAGPLANAALIRATGHAGAATVQDVSDVAFQIANAGTAYYVNDGSLGGDEYTAAVGNNANDGKTPGTPMASLAALLRAYDLDPGDVIYVDTGVYNLTTNIVLTAQDSGVTIRGSVLPTHDAVLNRGNTSSNAYVFVFSGASDVTLEHLNVTGGYIGILASGTAGNDGVTLRSMDVYSNSNHGVSLSSGHSDWVIVDSVIHNNGTNSAGISGSGAERLRIERNEIYGNATGVSVNANSEANRAFVIGNNVHDNSSTGINISAYVTARGNRVYNHSGIGIGGSGSALIEDNDTYNNATGIQVSSGVVVAGNRSFGNVAGIRSFSSTVQGNYVYSNSTGVVDTGSSVIFNNLIYANTNLGLDISGNHGASSRVAYNNTIWQDTGEAIRVGVSGSGNNVWLYNNLLSIGAGYAANVGTNGQAGFVSDWNLYDLRETALIGRWGNTERPTLASWQAVSANHDAHGILGNPRFLDIDGADNVLGYQNLTTGDGYDDNFSLDAHSDAIDAGSAYQAALTDIEGRERQDDPTTANTGIGWDRFVESQPGGSSYAETGTAIPSMSSTNAVATVNLPFTFNYFGVAYTSVQVSVNGYLHFGGQDAASNGNDNTPELFLRNARIAPLWDNLRTDQNQSTVSGSTPGNVFVDTGVTGQITFRWAATREATGGGDVNFSVTLYADGRVRFDYGDGNQALTPTVGLSAGNGFTFALSQYHGATNLHNAASVLFTPNEGLTYFDVGAYEFLGNSGDTIPPTVVSVSQLPSPGGSTALAFSGIQIETSEALNSISAKSPANYDLRRKGPDGQFDTSDDIIIPLRPSYSYPETNLTLEFLLGPNATPGILPDGDYRLTLSGTKAIYDLSGNPLDGNANGTGGDDYVRFFTINRTANAAPVANAQTVSVNEDGAVTITLSASDANGDPLVYSLVSAPAHGTLSDFDPAARTVRYTPNAGYTGPDSFQFMVDDGKAGTATATVTINVQPVNDAPVAQNQAVTLDEDTPRLIVLDGTDTETARPDLIFTLMTAPQYGTLVQGPAGGWTYTPNVNYTGEDSFTYTVRDRGDPDGSGTNAITTAPATVTLTIVPVNDAPQIAAVADQVVLEGSVLLVNLAATDPESHALAWSLDSAPAGMTIDAVTGTITWTARDGPAEVLVTARATDAGTPSAFDTVSFVISVQNLAPTLTIAGAAEAIAGTPYVLTLASTDLGTDTIASWEINWGDGNVELVEGDPTSVTHVYALGGGSYSISATATDEDGTFDSNAIEVEVRNDSLRVVSLEETATGFKARFSHTLDASVINLYSSELVPHGAADVVLRGAATGVVRGSLVLDADQMGLTFIKTGGLLAADTYTVRLVSGANAFLSAVGALDGDGDDVAGGDYLDGFTITASNAPVLSITDFARGNGQSVDVPATDEGLTIRLSDASGVRSIAFTLGLAGNTGTAADALIVESVSLAPGLVGRATLTVDTSDPSALRVTVSVNADAGDDADLAVAGDTRLVLVHARVGMDAQYGSKQILDLADIEVNGVSGGARDDDGLQVVALFGDSDGNREYTTADVAQLQRVILRYDTGLGAYPNLDPIIAGDISGNGLFSALDLARLLAEVRHVWGIAGGVDDPAIPAIPEGVGSLDLAGPDPKVELAKDVRVEPGETFVVPLTLDTTAGLSAVRLRLGWDAGVLELVEIGRGSVTGDFQWYIERRGEGEAYVDLSRLVGLGEGTGSLLELKFRVAEGAAAGVTDLDLRWVRLNEGRLTLNPRPVPGWDESDGRVWITGQEAAEEASAAEVVTVADEPRQEEVPIGVAVSEPEPVLTAGVDEHGQAVGGVVEPTTGASEPVAAGLVPVVDLTPEARAEERPGLLGALGEALKRKLGLAAARAVELEAEAGPVVPVSAVTPMVGAETGVQVLPRVELSGGGAERAVAGQRSAEPRGWLRGFVGAQPAGSPNVNANLKVTLPSAARTSAALSPRV